MSVEVCTDSPRIKEDIALLNQALSDDGELMGERLCTLARILKKWDINN